MESFTLRSLWRFERPNAHFLTLKTIRRTSEKEPRVLVVYKHDDPKKQVFSPLHESIRGHLSCFENQRYSVVWITENYPKMTDILRAYVLKNNRSENTIFLQKVEGGKGTKGRKTQVLKSCGENIRHV